MAQDERAKGGAGTIPEQPYGDLTALNRTRLLLDGVGREVLDDLVLELLELLGTSAAVYERDGDYAAGIFVSGWCRLLDAASRQRCGTDDNAEALESGRWLCHESCWTEASKVAIETGEVADIACNGGLRLRALPIVADGECVGAINFGYGDPPTDPEALDELAARFQLPAARLGEVAASHVARSPEIVAAAKRRLEGAARQLGQLVERRRVEQQHRESRALLQSLLDHAPVYIHVVDLEGRVVLLNRLYEQTLGLRPGELEGKRPEALFAPEALARVAEQNREILEAGEARTFDETVPLSGGEVRQATTIKFPLLDEQGQPWAVGGITSDVTEQRRFEAKLREAHKLESLGVLAGGIAHDFNNLLVGVLTNASLVLHDLPADSEVRPAVAEIEQAGARLADLCRQMLHYSGHGKLVEQRIDLNDLVDGMERMLRLSLSKKARLLYRLSPDLPAIAGDPAQLSQVVLSLLTNASEALGEGQGDISLRTRVRDCDAAFLARAYTDRELPAGRYVALEVQDTGCGMDAETLARVFDPFFSTKFTGRGLGLAVVHGIARGHGGAVRVSSALGQGTTFSLLLPPLAEQPRADGDPRAEAGPTAPADGRKARRVGKVLLVDDEPTVRAVAEKMLRRLGFDDVVVAGDGLEAVGRFEREPHAFGCVVLDLTMPRMDGEQALAALRRIRDDVPVLIATGYGAERVAARFAELPRTGLLGKPFRIAELSAALARLLDG